MFGGEEGCRKYIEDWVIENKNKKHLELINDVLLINLSRFNLDKSLFLNYSTPRRPDLAFVNDVLYLPAALVKLARNPSPVALPRKSLSQTITLVPFEAISSSTSTPLLNSSVVVYAS